MTWRPTAGKVAGKFHVWKPNAGCSCPVRSVRSAGPASGSFCGSRLRVHGIVCVVVYSMFLVKWVPIFSKQTWILAKSSHFIESPFSLEHKIFRKKRSGRHFRCFCGEFCTLPVNYFHFTESAFYREQLAADVVQKFPFYRECTVL